MGITVRICDTDNKWFGADAWDQADDGDLTLIKEGNVIARFPRHCWAGFWTDEALTAEPRDE